MSIWKVHPVYLTIMEILREKGSMTDTELLEALRVFYKDIGMDDLNKNLMAMEISGLIHVSSLTRGKRLIELKEK